MFNKESNSVAKICQQCKEEIHSDQLYVQTHDSVVLSLSEYVGLALRTVQDLFSRRADGEHVLHNACNPIRNDRFIDLSLKYPDPKHDWQKGMVKNEHGWAGEKEGITGDYVIQEGDEGHFTVFKLYHNHCHGLMLAEMESDANPVLAGVPCPDFRIEKELKTAGISRVDGERSTGEVAASVTGKLGQWKFSRAWYYWIAWCDRGGLPLDLAKEMHWKRYLHDANRKYGDVVRVAGHCGCPPPEEWAKDSPVYGKVVTSYHIDTQEGLNEFARMVNLSKARKKS